eukprot:COSAG06_NODE_12478_length_1375_cov_829.811912_2_plen_74_part_00
MARLLFKPHTQIMKCIGLKISAFRPMPFEFQWLSSRTDLDKTVTLLDLKTFGLGKRERASERRDLPMGFAQLS